MQKFISYSVVLFNQSPDDIEKLVNNILDTVPETISGFQLFLVNNSVTNDRVTDVIRELDRKNSNIISIVPSENKGFGAGHNYAINQAKSDYHFIVNPDVVIPDADQIDKLIECAELRNAVLVAPKVLYPNGDLQPLVKRTPTVFDMMIRFLGKSFFLTRQRHFAYLDTGYDQEILSNNLPGSFLMANTDILQQIGGFDERYFLYMEDSDLSRAMSEKGVTLYTPSAYIEHELQRNNRKKLSGQMEMIKSMIKYFNKWGWRLW